MSEYLERAKALLAHELKQATLITRLDLLDGLIREQENLQLALAHEINVNKGLSKNAPKDISSVVELASKRGKPSEREPEEQK